MSEKLRDEIRNVSQSLGRLRVLHVVASVAPASGGPIEGIIRQDEAARAYGVREVVSLDPPEAPYLSNFPIKVHAMGLPLARRGKGLLAHYGYSPKLIAWLRAHRSNYDAIIVNGLWNYSTFGASVALREGRIPYYVFTHGMMDPWFRRTYPL